MPAGHRGKVVAVAVAAGMAIGADQPGLTSKMALVLCSLQDPLVVLSECL